MENSSNKLALLKKIQLKLEKLMEKRKVFAFFDPDLLFKKEKEVKDTISGANQKKNIRHAQQATDAAEAKAQQKIDKKKNLKVSKTVRMTIRSNKPELEILKKDVVETAPEILEMRRYIGSMTDVWEQEMFK